MKIWDSVYIFNKMDSSVKGKILFINHGKREGRNIPMVEVKVDSKEPALGLRRGSVAQKECWSGRWPGVSSS